MAKLFGKDRTVITRQINNIFKDDELEEKSNMQKCLYCIQRVALIRSLAIKPDILLLDEPFSALDYYTRTTISEDVLKIIKKTNTSTIIITHDIAEALSLADRIIVLSKRPSVVKKIYEIDFCDEENILKKRSLKKFSELYESIWRDLDEKV